MPVDRITAWFRIGAGSGRLQLYDECHRNRTITLGASPVRSLTMTCGAGSGVEQGSYAKSSPDSGRAGGNPYGIEYRLTKLELRGIDLAADRRIGALSLETQTHEYRCADAEPSGLSGDFHRFWSRATCRARARKGPTLPPFEIGTASEKVNCRKVWGGEMPAPGETLRAVSAAPPWPRSIFRKASVRHRAPRRTAGRVWPWPG